MFQITFLCYNHCEVFIASMIKPSWQYLGMVSNKTSFQKLGAFCRPFSAKKRRKALKGKSNGKF